MSITTTLHSNLRFLSPPYSAAGTATATFISRNAIRCGPRDSRGPLVKGRTLSTEAIQAVQYLKRLHRTTTTTTTTDLRSTAHNTLSRLIKTDLLAALRELLRQDHTTLALLALSVLNSEHGHGDGPDLSLYADVAAALSRTGRGEEIDWLVEEIENLGLGLGFDEKGLVKLLKAVISAGRRESTVRIYGRMRKNGWGSDTWKADDYVVKVLSRGFRRLGEEGLANEIENEFGGVNVYKPNRNKTLRV